MSGVGRYGIVPVQCVDGVGKEVIVVVPVRLPFIRLINHIAPGLSPGQWR